MSKNLVCLVFRLCRCPLQLASLPLPADGPELTVLLSVVLPAVVLPVVAPPPFLSLQSV